MASGAAVPHPLRHGVGLVPDNVLPQIPAVRPQGHGQCPGNAQQVLVFEASTVFPAVAVAYNLYALGYLGKYTIFHLLPELKESGI